LVNSFIDLSLAGLNPMKLESGICIDKSVPESPTVHILIAKD
jgi:hypothetical protein